MSDIQPQDGGETPARGTVHHVVFSDNDPPHAEPHPLEGKAPPATASLEVSGDALNGETVDIIATFEEFMGMVELRFTASQKVSGDETPHLMRENVYQWSGQDSPHTTRIELVGWFPVVPADCLVEFSVVDGAKLAELTFTVAPSG